jgi:hypothetical protein
MKTKYIIAALALMTASSSCSGDWLSTKSHDQVYINEYYNSEARITELLMAAYSPMHYYDYNGAQYNPLPIVFDVMGDDIYPGAENPNDQRHFHLLFNYSALPTVVCDQVWMVSYEGINRANDVALYMPGVRDISDDTKELILAEAVVLRTFYYNILWKLWGNIPYYEVNLTAPYIHPQSSAAEVYDKMVAGLESVLESESLPMIIKTPSQLGRISWAMAAMLYTEMVMYQNDSARYDKALGYMNDIIGSGEYNLINYADIFEQVGEWSTESIFEINYFSQGAYRDYGGAKNAGGTIYPRVAGIESLTGSAKYAESGWGTGVVLTAVAQSIFKEGDLRKEFSVYEPAAEGATYSPRYQDTGFFLAKYLPRHDSTTGQIATPDMNHNNNLRIYRFSETLLNAAELLARGASGSGSADDYLTRVRTRAGLDAVPANVDNILDERHVEFMGEGKRYFDLVRSGKAATTLTPANDAGEYRKNAWTENKKYLPIPQSEIDASRGSLTQNNY